MRTEIHEDIVNTNSLNAVSHFIFLDAFRKIVIPKMNTGFKAKSSSSCPESTPPPPPQPGDMHAVSLF